MPAPTVKHPIFARGYGYLSRFMERELGQHRAGLLAGLSGRVVEVGAGNGMNFAHYPASVAEVVAVEPEPYLRGLAQEQARDPSVGVPVRVEDGVAEQLPAADGEFDAAVACLVLCSVTDQARALAELRRVLRPGGELRYLEHVRAAGGRKATVQSLIDRSGAWRLIAGGCYCARDTGAELRAAGFEIEREQEIVMEPPWFHTNPMLLGVARAPAA